MAENKKSTQFLEEQRVDLVLKIEQAQREYLDHYQATHTKGNPPVSCHRCGY